MAKLQEMGEFVRSASSTIEAPVVRRLKDEFAGQVAKASNGDGAKAPAARRAAANGRAAAPAAAAEVSTPAAAPELTSPEAPAAQRPGPAITVPFPQDQSVGPQVPPTESRPAPSADEPSAGEPGVSTRQPSPRPAAAGPRPSAPPAPGQR